MGTPRVMGDRGLNRKGPEMTSPEPEVTSPEVT